jgi:hypothetical protein
MHCQKLMTEAGFIYNLMQPSVFLVPISLVTTGDCLQISKQSLWHQKVLWVGVFTAVPNKKWLVSNNYYLPS